ncbi:chlorinating enzyme [Bradyrhizobium sp. USDA 4532]|uniref:phytanoyl-CoA dioxygenase family protein n=1 Tax=unclassified Bradyrhizobium TaxID=2631580 RepID=UPI00209EB8C2|nr:MULTISPECIES: phytanoyl-CoA dioxygenase family protein [unclassified Bradyrhizobium]MCP1835455.1 chlorinating enzyme [Bradyrhizobium sp. USDA 4545]MCP1920201.1 chlorinating enzyme [Bradyrhizobium sp. USDA 4532]
MPKILSEAQVQQYRSKGFVCPIDALSAEEANEFLARMEDLESREPNLWARSKIKPHLLMMWLNDLMRNSNILDAVEDVLGPDIMAWATGHFDKKPHDPSFVSWHQDGTYWGLSEPSVVTAWIALTPSNRNNGCMRVIPGSHHQGQLPHRDTDDKNNLLSRGQDVEVKVDEADAVDLELRPGQISLHHTMLIHGSKPNFSDTRRLGITIRYVAAHVSQTSGYKDSATLVRGTDKYRNFVAEPRPSRDFDPDAVEFYEAMVAESRRRKEAIAAQHQSRQERLKSASTL